MSKNHDIHTSEWVSLGHPDKLADFITSYILDRYLEQDPNTRYAVEVLIKDYHVVLAGEVTSKADISHDDLKILARTAVLQAGYDRIYQDKWGAANTICGDDLDVKVLIGRQSPDIAQGVDTGRGWGDQGIFWGMAVDSPETDYLPADYFLARKLGRQLYDSPYGGIDIKTLVSTDVDGVPREVVAAVPVHDDDEQETVRGKVLCAFSPAYPNCILNGTGAYRVHGPVGDCGVTGRKLACDFYGGNCRVGGGSPWGKDPTKADVTLNILARQIALDAVRRHGLPTAYCSIACCIGCPSAQVTVYDERFNVVDRHINLAGPERIINDLHLRNSFYATRCRYGLFCDID